MTRQHEYQTEPLELPRVHNAHNNYGHTGTHTMALPGEWVTYERVECTCTSPVGYFVTDRIEQPE